MPRVLLADADHDSVSLYTAHFGQAGYVVQSVSDGVTALERSLAEPPHLLVTELALPRLDGIALCEVLRRDAATRHLRVVVATSLSDGRNVMRARKFCDALFLKPVDVQLLLHESNRLITCVRESLEGSRALLETSRRLVADSQRVVAEAHVAADAGRARRVKPSTTVTTTPPTPAPTLRCPRCDAVLTYQESYLSGPASSMRERWDAFTCPNHQARFEYRHRTRMLREIA